MARAGLVKTSITLLADGKKTFIDLPRKSFEDLLAWYMKLLLLSAVAAAVFSFVRAVTWAWYLNSFRGVTVNVGNLLNYSFGIATGTFFIYLFVGTFGMFAASLVVWFVLGKRLKLTHSVMACAYAMTPVYLLGWLASELLPALLLWSLFLLVTGLSALRATRQS